MSVPAPRILTLMLDAAAQEHFDALRTTHFPPDRLFIGAHVTLFHALPGHLRLEDVVGQEATANNRFPVTVTGVRFLGRGVAFVLESAPLLRMRERLRRCWAESLTPQDRQPWQPHVTIQNKVEPSVARALHKSLSAGFGSYSVTATGLGLWIYRNGPWDALAAFPFKETPQPQAG